MCNNDYNRDTRASDAIQGVLWETEIYFKLIKRNIFLPTHNKDLEFTATREHGCLYDWNYFLKNKTFTNIK